MVVDTTAKFPIASSPDALLYMQKLNSAGEVQGAKRRNSSNYALLPPKKKMCLYYAEQGTAAENTRVPSPMSGDYLQAREDEVIVIDDETNSSMNAKPQLIPIEDVKLEALDLSKRREVPKKETKRKRLEMEVSQPAAHSKSPEVRTVVLPICIPVPVVETPQGYSPVEWPHSTVRRHSAPASSLYLPQPGNSTFPGNEIPGPPPPLPLHQPLRSPGWNEARYHNLLPGAFNQELKNNPTSFRYPALPSQLTGTTLPGSYHREMPPPVYRPAPRNVKNGPRAAELIPRRLPSDPRDWTKAQVHQWLAEMSSKFKLLSATPDRFPMNGKGVNMMSLSMFLDRVPRGGHVLYSDFSRRVTTAMAQGPLVRAASA